MTFRTGPALMIGGLTAVLLCGAILAAGPPPTAAAASAGFTAAFEGALARAGGNEAATERAAAFDAAVAAGVPLADAGLSEADYFDLAAQGSNVIVECHLASDAVAELNVILAMAEMATQVPCGAFNPDAPAVEIGVAAAVPIAESGLSEEEQAQLIAAGYDAVGPCDGTSGVLSAELAAAGGSSWFCGSTPNQQAKGTP
jgi:hypothetical protein